MFTERAGGESQEGREAREPGSGTGAPPPGSSCLRRATPARPGGKGRDLQLRSVGAVGRLTPPAAPTSGPVECPSSVLLRVCATTGSGAWGPVTSE